ncbi:uncharacterized protein LOC120837858, partial [Ixodes scapularis]|uniref:uncharacterized protein LOC120837858 n=1 Tax=Ixodes scapularis TaxID=6945 RepID=UPI001C3933FD
YTKKSSNRCLLLLPGPQCCLAIVSECTAVIRQLLLLCGDVEVNPGPVTTEAMMALLTKLDAGQTTVTVNALSDRMTRIEQEFSHFNSIRNDLDELHGVTATLTNSLATLAERVDDSENRSRRSNLLFFGLPDSDRETWAQSEQKIINLCSQHLDINIMPDGIERAHRLGRYRPNQNRPIIVKFALHKTKERIFSQGKKFKDTSFAVSEDFSPSVQLARRNLLTFARNQAMPFSLRFKTLLIGQKRYYFDDASNTVKECPS